MSPWVWGLIGLSVGSLSIISIVIALKINLRKDKEVLAIKERQKSRERKRRELSKEYDISKKRVKELEEGINEIEKNLGDPSIEITNVRSVISRIKSRRDNG